MSSITLELVGYRRVSTEDQRDKGSSLEVQTARLEAFCARPGVHLLDIIDDGGESARTMDRPGLATCLSMIRSGAVGGIVVANLDRLTRHVGDLVGLVESDFLAVDGPVLLSASEPVETRTAVGRMQLYILATVSQYARESGAENTVRVMRHKRSKGERAGNLGFGQAVDATDPRRSKSGQPIALVESPEDLRNETIIVSLYNRVFTLQAIADELNILGIPSKRGVTKRSTGKWAKSSVHAVLKRYFARREIKDGGVDEVESP